MRFINVSFFLGAGLTVWQSAPAQNVPTWIGAPDCRVASIEPVPVQVPSWHGACKDGYAEGNGVLEWNSDKDKPYKLDAVLAAGRIQGEVTLTYPDGRVYIGTMANGLPEGRGYYKYTSGDQYVGDIRKGILDGSGEMLYVNGDDYKGQWKNGKRHGTGVLAFTLGGRYDGAWKDDAPNGPGKLIYAGDPPRDAATIDGHALDEPQATAAGVRKTYKVMHDAPSTEHLFRDEAARSIPVFPELGYDRLPPDQQAIIRSWYPALAPGDEPPYPLHGPAEFVRTVSALSTRLQQYGLITLYVNVDKNGKGDSVRAIGLDDPEARKILATAAMLVKYKAARCAGQPCNMMYIYKLFLKQ